MKKSKFIFYLFLLSLLLLGCDSKKEKVKEFEKKERAPASLQDINESLDKLMDNNKKIEETLDNSYLEDEKEEKKREEEEKKDKKEEDKDKKEEDQDREEDKKEEEDIIEKERKKREEENEIRLIKTWKAMDREIEKLHKLWNEYGEEGDKKANNPGNAERFSNSLNLLTIAIENRQVLDIYDHGSQAMNNISPIFQVYKDEIWGEINKIRYSVYQSYLKFLKQEFLPANRLLEDSKEEVAKIRLKIEKDDSKIKALDRLALSIDDLQKALKDNSLKLIRIKKDLTLENLKELGK